MAPEARSPLISLEGLVYPKPRHTEDQVKPQTGTFRYFPLSVGVLLILAPHSSWLVVLVRFHLLVLRAPLSFAVHLLVTYALTFVAFSSLIVCVARDPGPVTRSSLPGDVLDEEDVTSRQRLLTDEDDAAELMWCRKCEAEKPERTHHCSQCGRCVLKMDHHCPWLANKCLGHRTYPAFIQFLASLTLLAIYIAAVSISAFMYAFNNPLTIDENTPVHELLLALAGIIFSIVIGSFLVYHLYLVFTNQTTIENINPFLLLAYLPEPPPPPTGEDASPHRFLEHELSFDQRRIVREAHGHIRLYDLGWKRNFAQIFGWERKEGWVKRILTGGAGTGDGKAFPRNPHADELLVRLAAALAKAGKDN